DRTTTLTTLQSQFGLLTNDLINDSINAMMAVLFLNTARRLRSRSSTPTLPENFYFDELEDWSYSPPRSVVARDSYEAEILKDRLNLPPNYCEDGNFPLVPCHAHDVPASFTKNGRNMSSKQLCDDEIDKIFATMTARDVQKVWQQFLVNINIPAIREDSTIANNFEKLLSDVVRAGLWVINFFQPKDAQAIFFNLNNDLYTVNLNVLTLSGWNVASSIDLSHYNFTAQKGPEAIE
ncbi:4788_t:CDS:2, partial [Cetraspora pellucida]